MVGDGDVVGIHMGPRWCSCGRVSRCSWPIRGRS